MSKDGTIRPRTVTVTSNGIDSRVHLDGQDVSRSLLGADLRFRPGNLPKVTLDVIVYDLTTDVEGPVVVPEATRDLLVRLGWTPPAEEDTDAVH